MKRRRSETGQGIIEVAIVIAIIYGIVWLIVQGYKGAAGFINERKDEYLNTRPSQSIIFAGKAENVVTGEWPNNRLVILFLNGKEISRTETIKGEFPESNENTNDGLFVLRIDNSYNLTINDLNFEGNKGLNFTWKNNSKWPFSYDNAEIYRWFGSVEEGSIFYIDLPGKNLKFAIYVFEGPISQLPSSLLKTDSATMKHDGTVYVNGILIK